MCVVATVFMLMFAFVRTKGNNDQYNNAYAPAAVNFNDIFRNSISMLAEEPRVEAVKEENFHINSIPVRLVEFPSPTSDYTTTMTPPPPKYILNSSYLKNETESISTQPTVTANYTDESFTEKHQETVQVIPIKKNAERGVLDLLFPASRVRTFKGVFDTFRKILSHTFRKR